jgi:hypothetical protein
MLRMAPASGGFSAGALVLVSLLAPGAGEPAETAPGRPGTRICVPLPDNDAKIRRLVRRVSDCQAAFAARRWLHFAECGYPDPEEYPFWRLKTAHRLRQGLKTTRLVEWSLLRILQCGRLAVVFTSDQLRDAIGSPEESEYAVTGGEYWGFIEGEWYIQPPRSVFPPGKTLDSDDEKQDAWIVDPYERFEEVWVAPGAPERGEPSPDVSVQARLWKEGDQESREPSPAGAATVGESLERRPDEERYGDLRSTVCEYGRAILRGSDEEVSTFWKPDERGRPGFKDPSLDAIRAAAGTNPFGSFAIDRIQVDMNTVRVEMTFMVLRDEHARRGEKVRLSSFWFEAHGRWVRISIPVSAWHGERATDIRTPPCPDSRIRRIIVRAEEGKAEGDM